MKEKKNIDRIFQENFKDFEREPHEDLWGNIASRLEEKDRKKPVIIPLWWKIGGVAAVLAIILAGVLFTEIQNTVPTEPGIVIENPENSKDNEDAEKQQDRIVNGSKNSGKALTGEESSEITEKRNSSSNNQSTINNKNSNSQIAKQESVQHKENTSPIKTEPGTNNNTAIASEDLNSSATVNEKEETSVQPEVINNTTSGLIAGNEEIKIDSSRAESLLKEQNALAQIEEEKNIGEDTEVEAEIKMKRLRLSTFAAPVFYKNIGGGNELSNQLSNNSSSSEVTLSYGMKVAYQISNKLRIRTGISKIDVNNNIRDISYSPAIASSFENISPVEDNVEIRDNSPSISGGPLPMGGMENNSALTTAVATPGEINQQFGFIEIPLEIEYALIDRRFGLNLIGGGSSLFLDNNRVDLVSGDNKMNLGEATNINSTSFSTNIGLGMDYKLTDQFSISVEPIFKYQLNTFDNVNNVQPINIGVYSGLNFRF